MNKLIIDNQTELSLSETLWYVGHVLDGGMISNDGKQHCYLSVFHDGVEVITMLNKKSERFIIKREVNLNE